jgi:hypothetical protein
VHLLSRNRLPQSYPPIADAIKHPPMGEVILDDEVTWGNEGGVARIRFSCGPMGAT